MPMGALEELLATLLIDIIKAQHQANLFSARLANLYYDPEKYGLDPNLSYFPVPNSVIKSFDLNMKLAPEKVEVIVEKSLESGLREAFGLVLSQLKLKKDEQEKLIKKALAELTALSLAGQQDRDEIIGQIAGLPKGKVKGFDQQWEEALQQALRQHLPAELQLSPEMIKDLLVNYNLQVIKDVGEDKLWQINLLVDMRSFTWGFNDKDQQDKGNPRMIPLL